MSLALIVVTCVSLSVGFVISDEGDDDNEDELVKGFEQ